MNGAETADRTFYTGYSMRGMFVPGEMLRLAETTFDRLRPGDVVAILDRTPHVVHRIVEKSAVYAITMGDNNARPDAWKLTPRSSFRIVTDAVSADGTVRAVAGGTDGMKQFRRQQRKRKLRRFAGWLVRPLKPLKFLRIPARRVEQFRDGTVQWSFGGIPVAARGPSGRTVYLHWTKRLFFRVQEPEEQDGTVRHTTVGAESAEPAKSVK
jgi:hypothetical protein